MPYLQYKTRNMSNPKGKPRVYFTCHSEDFDAFFPSVSTELLSICDCAVWYASKEEQRSEDFLEELGYMQLFVIPVTEKLLTADNTVVDTELKLAIEHHIPILPLMQENGLESLFNQKFGSLQFLNKNCRDLTAISYEEKLKKYLGSVFSDSETVKKIRNNFDAYIFLSYRKKDRKYANELMRLIHKNEFCENVAIWYDEFLTPGENFNESIKEALEKSDLFVLTVTPHLVETVCDEEGAEKENYIVQIEYPLASECKKTVLPIEMVQTDNDILAKKYENIPSVINAREQSALASSLKSNLANAKKKFSPENDFLMGLAYLEGIDVEVDHERAVRLIKSAAEKGGVLKAAERLVKMYGHGQGVPRSAEDMLYWQNLYIFLLEEDYAQASTKEKGLSLLTEQQALSELLRRLGENSQLTASLQARSRAAIKIHESYPCPETAQHLSAVAIECGDLLLEAECYSDALKNYQQSRTLLDTALEFKSVALSDKDIRLNSPLDMITMILLQDYCTCLCNIADVLKITGFEEKSIEKLQEAEGLYVKVCHYLLSDAMANNYPAYRKQLSTAYSRLGEIEKCKGNYDKAKDWYKKALQIDEQLVSEIKENRDFDAYDSAAKGLFALGTLNEEDPDTRYLYPALYIWELLSDLVPQFPEYREKAEALTPYVQAVGDALFEKYREKDEVKDRSPWTYEGYKSCFPLMYQKWILGNAIFPLRKLYSRLRTESFDFNESLSGAKANKPEAMMTLADCYLNGKGTAKDEKQALYWAHKAAEQGYSAAYVWLTDLYESKEPSKAEKYRERARILSEEEQHRKAFEEFEAALTNAHNDDPEAMLKVADHYLKGTGIEQNTEKALYWAKKAADTKHIFAYSWLMEYYKDKNPKLAKEYLQTKELLKEQKEAFNKYLRSALSDEKDAFLALADCYFYGNGISKNVEESFKWANKALSLGDSKAYSHLAEYYYGERKYSDAIKYAKKGVKYDKESADRSCNILRKYYSYNAKNPILAKYWEMKRNSLRKKRR